MLLAFKWRFNLVSFSVVHLKREFCIKINQPNQLEICENFINRNPRNLERMQIGYKPDGYHVEKPGRSFWHKLTLSESGRYARATIEHFENGIVLEASTSEWALKKQLYKCNNTSAFYNLGRVMAERCLKAGLTEVSCGITESSAKQKIVQFLNAMREGGVTLKEPSQFKPPRPWDQYRNEKPWQVTE